MRTERSTGYGPGRDSGHCRGRARTPAAGAVAAALVVVALASGAGCAGTVPGTPWPEGRGPAPPAVAGPAGPGTAADGPSSFVVPGPLSPTPTPTPTRTVPPVPADPTGGAAPGASPPGTTPGPAGPGTGTPGAPGTGAAAPDAGAPGAGPDAPDAPGAGAQATGPVPRPGAASPQTTRTTPAPAPGRTAAGVPEAGTSARADGARPTRVVPPLTAGGTGDPGRAPLTADVVADECLLADPALTGLLGSAPVVPAAGAGIRRADGTTARSCFAVGRSASVAVNVYTTNVGTPVGYVRAAAGARPLGGTGAGTAAALLETVAGPTLQVGTARYLVTVAVAGRHPSDAQWRTAARRAAAALPR